MMLAVLCIRTMAKRHGNLEKMKIQNVKLSHIKKLFYSSGYCWHCCVRNVYDNA